MIGELVQGMLREAFDGNEDIASLPYRFGVVAAGGQRATGRDRSYDDAYGAHHS